MRPTLPAFSPAFLALLKEAEFTKEMLGAGATQIRRANYATKGVYFQAFASLSTGLERIGKLCVMLDHYIDHGQFPDMQFMKDKIGHDIVLLYEKSKSIVSARSINLEFLKDLDDPIHQAIIRILSEFGRGDRYSSINLLTGAKRQSDPIASWHIEVDRPLFEARVSEKAKEKIRRNATIASALLGSHSMVLHTSETGDMITDMEDGSYRTGMSDAVAPYRQLYVMQVVRYWAQLLSELYYVAKDGDIPHLSEVFALFKNDDAYIRTRKTWESL